MAIGRWAVLVMCCGAGPCVAEGVTLTEQEALARAMNQPALQSLEAGEVGAGEGDVAQARSLSNPVVALQHERIGTDERESTYTIAQRFELGGKRGLRADAARGRLAAARAEVQARRRSIADEVRRRFYETLASQANVAALRDWERRLAETEQIALRLQKGGEAAGYDRRRVARERATATSRLRQAEADAARAQHALRALLGVEPDAAIVAAGSVLPDPPRPVQAYLAGLASRPDMRALAARADASRHEEKLAQRDRLPDVTLSAGMKQIDRGPLGDSGVVFGVSLPLPLFDRGQGASRRAAGRAEALAAERSLRLARAQGDVRGLWQQASALHAAAEEFRREALEGSRRLAEIARAAYRGGEAGILELLDAQRSLADAELRALELETAARAAALELELAGGES